VTPKPAPRNVQLRVESDLYETLKDVARRKGTSIAECIREALQLYLISIAYSDDGRQLMWTDPATGQNTEVLIPGITSSRPWLRQPQTRATAHDR
jgi:hypothetical protein